MAAREKTVIKFPSVTDQAYEESRAPPESGRRHEPQGHRDKS